MDNAILEALQQADSNYEGVEAADGFELHPEFKGVGEVEIARIEQKDGGKIQLFVRFKTDEGGCAVWQTLSGFTEKNTEQQVAFTKKFLLHLGHTGTFAELAQSTAHLIGRKVEIQVKHETYEGVKREKVYTNRAVEGDMDADLSGFASQFNAVPTATYDNTLPADFPGQPQVAAPAATEVV